MSRPDVTPKIKVDLQGVPETLLWNLYFRAAEARRTDAVLRDAKAVELVDSIDFPFAERFGRANGRQAQAQALRARAFDEQVTSFLARQPDATVVALGEGLETQSWRVDNGQVRWLTVELPETANVRRALLSDSPRRRILAASALDTDWMEQVDPTHAVLISAQGLLMYFQPDDVRRLIDRCGERLPGATMLFDAMPRWFSRRTVEGKMSNARGYRPPPMPWGVDTAELQRLRELPHVAELREIPMPSGRGLSLRWILPAIKRVPAFGQSPLSIFFPWRIFEATFGGTARF